MKFFKLLSKLIFSVVLFSFLCINLAGCCGHSGGSSSSPVNKTTIGEAKVNEDGSVYFSGEGITLRDLRRGSSITSAVR